MSSRQHARRHVCLKGKPCRACAECVESAERPVFPLDLDRYERYVNFRRLFEYLAVVAVTPIRVPARRRRSDREVPKAA